MIQHKHADLIKAWADGAEKNPLETDHGWHNNVYGYDVCSKGTMLSLQGDTQTSATELLCE